MDIELIGIKPSAKVDLDRWAKITIEKWQYNIVRKKLINTGSMLKSFEYSISHDADNNTALISFAFKYYLRMLEMGVGKGVSYEDVGDLKESRRLEGKRTGNRRKPIKKLYSTTFYSELYRLSELLTNAVAQEGAKIIVDEFKHGTGDKTAFDIKK
jgi:hypothetical protein